MANRRLLFLGNSGFDYFARHCPKYKIDSIVLAQNNRHRHLADEFRLFSPEAAPAEIIDAILSYRPEAVVSFVSPLTEQVVVRNAIVKEVVERRHGIRVVGHPLGAAAVSTDKGHMKHLFSGYGVPTPPGGVACNRDELALLSQAVGFPNLIKRCTGNAGLGVFLARGEEELFEIYDRFSGGRVVLEACLSGDDYGVEVLRYEGRVWASPTVCSGPADAERHPTKRIRIGPRPGRHAEQEAVRQAAIAAAEALDVEGLCQVDLVAHEGKPFVLEVNGRYTAMTNLTPLSTGIDTREELIKMALGIWEVPPTFPTAHAANVPLASQYVTSARDQLERMGLRSVFAESETVHHGLFRVNDLQSFHHFLQGLSCEQRAFHPDDLALLEELAARGPNSRL